MESIRKIEEGLKQLFDENVGKFEREPDVDIFDMGDGLLLLVDLPGVRKDSIKVKVYERAVEVFASPAAQDGPGKPLRRERISNFPLSRRIELPYRLRIESARAIYRDGVLQVIVGKAGEAGSAELKVD